MHRDKGQGDRVRSPGAWRGAALIALAMTLAVQMGCASLGEPSGLTPTSTVASAMGFAPEPGPGLKMDLPAASFDVPQGPSGEETQAIDSQESAADATPQVTLAPVLDEDGKPSLEVNAHNTQRLTLRLTPLTLGEALVFLQGGKVRTTQGLSVTLEPGPTSRTEVSSQVDLSAVEGWEGGLMAAESEAVSTNGARSRASQLLQLSALKVTATLGARRISLEVTTPDAARVKGAEVELLNADGRTLARGRTDDAGQLEITRPTVLIPALLGDDLYLTVRNRGQRALIKL